MAKKKYYAVRNGARTGIFLTWEECRKQVIGFPGARYKSFGTEEEARAYLEAAGEEAAPESSSLEETDRETPDVETPGEEGLSAPGEEAVKIYVDGSYNKETKEFSYGMVILRDGEELKFSGKMSDPDLAKMRNVAGEIRGAQAAMQYAADHHLEHIVIYHDYEGIACWCTGAWEAAKAGTRAYRDFYDSLKDRIKIDFVKVAGHSNDRYNDMADQLAREALGL